MLNKLSLSLSDARTVVAAAEAFAAEKGLSVGIAVVDQSTYLQHFSRMDGAGVMTGEAAVARARSAAGTGFPTAMWNHELKDNNNLFVLTIPGASPAPGGIPIVIDGQCVGAIGVAGGPPHLDTAVAEAGIAVSPRAARSDVERLRRHRRRRRTGGTRHGTEGRSCRASRARDRAAPKRLDRTARTRLPVAQPADPGGHRLIDKVSPKDVQSPLLSSETPRADR